MKISTKGRYALRLMLDIAQNSNGEYVRLKDIAFRQEISEKYLEQITGLLTKRGLIKGERGSQGGYRLVKKPADYTIGSILQVTEGSLAPVACLDDSENLCPRSKICKH
jgi:Rrf2 family protein